MPDPNQAASGVESVPELVALIAATAKLNGGGARVGSDSAGKAGPARPLPDVAIATRAISGWYERALGYESSTPDLGQVMSLDDVVRKHVAMRKEWERREAVSLSTWLSRTLSYAPKVELAAAVPAIASESPATVRRALLIDDSSDILVTVGAFLEAFGFVVTLASDSQAALEVLSKQQIDLLVTDHAMPGMTGKDLAIEAMQQNPALRAMIITGYPDLQELKELPSSVAVLAKPFRRAELFARLRALFERRDESDSTMAFASELCTPSR